MEAHNRQCPLTRPTPLEELIWSRTRPALLGGVLRQGSTAEPYELTPCAYGPRDKSDPDSWDCKLRGGPDAEWWVYMMQGAKRVIDVGCGFGFPSFYLAANGFEVVGVDPSPSEIATARAYARQQEPGLPLEYVVSDQYELPFDDSSFDGACFSGVLGSSSDPERLIREVIRVLKPGAIAAFDEEDRALEPKTHPVSEIAMLAVIDDEWHLSVETRVCEPYLHRRYMIRLADRFRPAVDLEMQKTAGAVLPSVRLDETGLSVQEVLEHAVDAEFGEARGYDAPALTALVVRMGFADLRFWARNNGRKFAEELQAAGLLDQMPEDIIGVLRALVRSSPPLASPTTLISCRAPG